MDITDDARISEHKPFINGIALRAPSSGTLSEYWDHLTHARDTSGQPMPGKHKFDADFFGFTNAEALKTDPSLRFLLELTYEAFVDAGMF